MEVNPNDSCGNYTGDHGKVWRFVGEENMLISGMSNSVITVHFLEIRALSVHAKADKACAWRFLFECGRR
jgi:hypothetical protein